MKKSVPKEVPEARLGDDLARRKDAHAVDFGGGVCIGGQVASDDLVFLKTHSIETREVS